MASPKTQETTEEKTMTVTLTFEEGAVLGINLLQLNMLARVGMVEMVSPQVMVIVARKLKEAAHANANSSGQGGPAAGSDRDSSSGEPSGTDTVPLP